MPLFEVSKFSPGETAVRFRWLLISGKRTHDESVIQKWLRIQACLHTYFPALWPEALARMGGSLATVKQRSGKWGQTRGPLSYWLHRVLNHLQPRWRKCAVQLKSRTQKNGQNDRQIYREGSTLRKIGKEWKNLEICVGRTKFLHHYQHYQPCLNKIPKNHCLDMTAQN